MAVVISASEFSIDHDKWISCSHWGMFPATQKTHDEA
jgi:hypothetical protein